MGILLTTLSISIAALLHAQRTFDVTIADSTYHMKQYWFVLYSTGADTAKLDSTASATLLNAHLAHQDEHAKRGLLAIAGPYGKNEANWRGLLLYDCETREEVEGYLRQDHMVKAARLAYTIAPWYGAVGTKLP